MNVLKWLEDSYQDKMEPHRQKSLFTTDAMQNSKNDSMPHWFNIYTECYSLQQMIC
jgi:hypothetical protein